MITLVVTPPGAAANKINPIFNSVGIGNKKTKIKAIIGKDFLKMIFGLSVSVGIVLAIHYIIIPNGFF